MSRLQLERAVDAVAVAAPGQRGYGYADTQYPWHHDAAIDLARTAFLQFVELLRERGLRGTVALVGDDRHGGIAAALRHVARVVVQPDAPEAIADVDCLLLLADDHDTLRNDFARYAPRVRRGGIVAIAESGQAYPSDGRVFDAAEFVAAFERERLAPDGLRMRRFGGARAIHWFEQPAAPRGWWSLPLPEGHVATPRPQPAGVVGGCALFATHERVVAIPTSAGTLDLRALHRNDYAVVLAGPTDARVAQLAATFDGIAASLAEARAEIRAGRLDAAARIVTNVRDAHPTLRDDLLASLAVAPHCRAVLLALGTFEAFGDAPRQGVALLRRALDQDMLDAALLRTVGTLCLRRLDDAHAARALLHDAKRQVRRRRITTVCHEQLSGNVLWHYPQLLQDVDGVVQVGAHRGEEVAAFHALGIRYQVYLEPNPEAFAELSARITAAAADADTAITALPVAAGERIDERVLQVGAVTEQASFLPWHPLADVAPEPKAPSSLRVPVRSLDDLVAEGRIDAARVDLLFVDTEGTELEVLRGARALLAHVDVVCVAIQLAPLRTGAPTPQQIQTFLREIDRDGFRLKAFEAGADPRRGDAVFQRVRAVRVPR